MEGNVPLVRHCSLNEQVKNAVVAACQSSVEKHSNDFGKCAQVSFV